MVPSAPPSAFELDLRAKRLAPAATASARRLLEEQEDKASKSLEQGEEEHDNDNVLTEHIEIREKVDPQTGQVLRDTITDRELQNRDKKRLKASREFAAIESKRKRVEEVFDLHPEQRQQLLQLPEVAKEIQRLTAIEVKEVEKVKRRTDKEMSKKYKADLKETLLTCPNRTIYQGRGECGCADRKVPNDLRCVPFRLTPASQRELEAARQEDLEEESRCEERVEEHKHDVLANYLKNHVVRASPGAASTSDDGASSDCSENHYREPVDAGNRLPSGHVSYEDMTRNQRANYSKNANIQHFTGATPL